MNLTWSDIVTVCNLDRGVADDRFVNIGGPSRSEGQLFAKRVCDKLATYDFVPASEIVKIEPKNNIFNLYSLWSSKYIDVSPYLLTNAEALTQSPDLLGNSFVMQKGYNVIKRVDVPLRRTGTHDADVVMDFYIADYDLGVPEAGATPVATLKVSADSIATTNTSDPNRVEIIPFIFEKGKELVVQPNTRVIFVVYLVYFSTPPSAPNDIKIFKSSVQYVNVTNNVVTRVRRVGTNWFSDSPVSTATLPYACRIWTSSTTQSAPVKPINIFYTDPSNNAFSYRKYLADPEIWSYNNSEKQIVFNSLYNNFTNLYLEYTHQWLVRDSETNEIKPYFEKGEDLWIMPQDFNECMYQGVLEYTYKKEKRFLEEGSTNDYQIVKSEFQQEINRVLALIPQVEKKHPQTSSYQY